MAKRARTASTLPAAPTSRTAALVAAASSLCLSTGLGAVLYVWTAALNRELASDVEAVDMDEMAVVAWWAGDAALRWAVVSAGGSLCGVLGLLLRKSSLHRAFAVTTATDLLVTIVVSLSLALLTFSPSLSPSFGSFLCSSTFASDWTSAPGLTARAEQRASWAGGIELVVWGLEACEDSWQVAMLGVLAGCAVAIVLRVLGTWITWEMNGEMRDEELRALGDAWVDQDDLSRQVEAVEGGAGDYKTPLALEEALGRPRSSSAACRAAMSERRTETLPLPYGLDSAKRARSQSVTFGQHAACDGRVAQLVFVPVMLDRRGHPIYQPSSPTYALPPSPSPPRSRQGSNSSTYAGTSAPSSSSRSSSRSNQRSRPRSASSSSSRSSLPSPLSDSLFVEESVEMSPPRTPIGQSSSTMSVEDKTSRRLRSRSEDVSLMSPPPP